jgi:phosphate/sulfate permease
MGGLVSFARGLNDTPKIVGMLVAAGALQPFHGVLAYPLVMAAAAAVGRVLR